MRANLYAYASKGHLIYDFEERKNEYVELAYFNVYMIWVHS